ncbi:MAG: hypothetical protein E7329_08325 [Clostridiales bacterium]|nr:hypothetical protein [Clostridiales bacterium]
MKKIHLVSHVHWDPAWYLPYEQYRITLIPLMRDLLAILETNPDYQSFMFDGQIDAIDDYLELFPEDKPRIEKLVKAGKLIIGPWYIQPEEFLLSGETHIRNMLVGLKKAKEYGGAMPITYLCDMVGHIPQMPQLIKGFGMDYFVGWRGILDGKERNEAAFIWQAPDGSQVVAKALTDGYYHLIPSDPQGFMSKVDEVYEKLLPYEKGDYVLFMQGADHRPAIGNIPDLIKLYNQEKGEEIIKQVSLLEHFEQIEKEKCKVICGEMRAAYYPGTFILSGILTARMSIKYKNEYVSRELEKWAEPFASFNAWVNGCEYPKALLDRAWMKQLKCAFHDCIYGGHVDAVTLDVFDHYKKALEITDWLNGESLYALSQSIKTVGDGDNITLFNPTPWERKNETVTFDYWIDAKQKCEAWEAFLEDGTVLPLQVNGVQRDIKRYTGYSRNQWQQCDPIICHRYSLSVVLPSLPGMGYRNIGIRFASHMPSRETDLVLHGHVCENTYLKVILEESGCLSVYDKENGVWYHHINQIEESGDKGDHYNYSKPLNDRIYFDKTVKANCYIAEHGSSRITFVTERDWLLPACVEENGRSSRQAANKIITRATLLAYSRAIQFKTTIDNQSKDHRYRLYIPSGIEGSRIQSGSQFYVNDRERETPLPETYIEKPMNNQPQRLFTDISDGKRGMAVFSRGFSEYDARKNGDIYFTMLRGVSHLSKATNAERFYHNAGPEYSTPGAQEMGRHEIEYALYFHSGDYIQGDVLKACDEFYAPPRGMQGSHYEGKLSPAGSYMELDGKGLLISAVKKAEETDEWIIRVYNGMSEKTQGKIKFILPLSSAYQTNMNEEHDHPLEMDNHTVYFSAGAYEIVSIGVAFHSIEK